MEPPIPEGVIDRYSALARHALSGETIVDCSENAFIGGGFGAAAYLNLEGVPEGASRASLGCGNPIEVADLQAGDTVLDLGSGGGIDVLLSAHRVTDTGKVYGLDASSEMLELARRNAAEAGVENVEFLQGSIEEIPLGVGAVDVVISNCVISLSVDKPAVLREAFRVLVPGGRFGVTDIVVDDDADPNGSAKTQMAVGSTEEALSIGAYRRYLTEAGFAEISVEPTVSHGDGVHSAIVRAVRGRANR